MYVAGNAAPPLASGGMAPIGPLPFPGPGSGSHPVLPGPPPTTAYQRPQGAAVVTGAAPPLAPQAGGLAVSGGYAFAQWGQRLVL